MLKITFLDDCISWNTRWREVWFVAMERKFKEQQILMEESGLYDAPFTLQKRSKLDWQPQNIILTNFFFFSFQKIFLWGNVGTWFFAGLDHLTKRPLFCPVTKETQQARRPESLFSTAIFRASSRSPIIVVLFLIIIIIIIIIPQF